MEWILIVLSRFAALTRKNKLDEELEDELRSHIELAVEENQKYGMPKEEALRKAIRDFGGMSQTREQYRMQRGVPSLETVWQDIHFGFRQLVKSPSFALTSILTLALGIGATTAIFSVVKTVLLAPLPYKDSERIIAVWITNALQGGQPMAATPADFEIWKERSGVFQDLAPSYDKQLTLTGHGTPELLSGYAVSAGYLRILGVPPQLGRLYTDQEDTPGGPKVALLSAHLWRTTFQSDPGIVGRAITLDGNSYTVLGVMPANFDYPASVEIWVPAALGAASLGDFDHNYLRVIGRLRHGISIAAAQQRLNDLESQIATTHPSTDSGNRLMVVPLREQLDGDIRKPLLILMGAVVVVLLIACTNTAGLALARDAERQKEIAVRLALGATRSRLLRQFLTESLLLGGIGGCSAVAIAFVGTRLLLRIFPNDVANLNIPRVTLIPMDLGVLGFALTITLLTSLLFGASPLLKTMNTKADASLKGPSRGNTADRRSGRSRNLLVVSEIALALMLLSAAGLVVASFKKVVDAKLGFQPGHVLSVQVLLPPDRYPSTDGPKRTRFLNGVLDRLVALPGVKSASATNFLPLSGFWGTINFLLPGQTATRNGQAPEADNCLITSGYLQTMGIALLRGRAFDSADRAGALRVAMINQAFANKYLAGRDPLGTNLNLGSADAPEWWRIVGIVGDVKAFGQDQPVHEEIYRPFAQEPFPLIAFTVRTERDPTSMIHAAEVALWSVDPELPVLKTIPLSTLVDQTLSIRRASSALISSFAILALVLACIGIYGVMAYAVSQRIQEIGVRMALGATRSDVLRMMMGMGARLTLLGISIGLAGTLACARLLSTILFEVSAINPLIVSLSVALLAVLSLTASWFPARIASALDPIKALRTQ